MPSMLARSGLVIEQGGNLPGERHQHKMLGNSAQLLGQVSMLYCNFIDELSRVCGIGTESGCVESLQPGDGERLELRPER